MLFDKSYRNILFSSFTHHYLKNVNFQTNNTTLSLCYFLLKLTLILHNKIYFCGEAKLQIKRNQRALKKRKTSCLRYKKCSRMSLIYLIALQHCISTEWWKKNNIN